MDNPETPESNKNGAKNFLYRLLKKKQRPTDSPAESAKTEDHPKETPILENPNFGCTRTRSSFRKNLKKMHTRVKSCVFPQKSQNCRQLDIPSSSSMTELERPPPVPPRVIAVQLEENHSKPTDEIQSLSLCYWYWGPMTRKEAYAKLKCKPDGSFLVRDSCSIRYLFSISFKSVDKVMHARIEYDRGKYNIFGHHDSYLTITELIQHAIKVSQDTVYCYTNHREDTCNFPVRLKTPISRYTEVRSLKYLCKFVVRQCTNINDIPKLPIPTVLYSYLLEGPYF